MDCKEAKTDPTKPMMQRRGKNLPPHKPFPVKLFDDGCDYEQEKENTTQDTCPPNEVIS